MATVDKDIKADSAQIKAVKKVIKNKSETIEHKQLTQEELAVSTWRDNLFSHPEKTVRLGTAFSGIGAIEHAFQRLGLKHEIVFAGDIDDKCRQSYFANYSISVNNWFSDIREFDASPYRDKVDFIIGRGTVSGFFHGGETFGV